MCDDGVGLPIRYPVLRSKRTSPQPLGLIGIVVSARQLTPSVSPGPVRASYGEVDIRWILRRKTRLDLRVQVSTQRDCPAPAPVVFVITLLRGH